GGSHGDGIPIQVVYVVVRLMYQHPAVGIPVAAIVVVFVVLSYNQGQSRHQGHVIRMGALAGDVNRRWAALARIREGDPGFDEGLFGQRVRTAFLKIQQAWSAQDLSGVRAFISDGIHERFSLQLLEQRELGYRNAMDKVTVGTVEIVELLSRGPFDVVTVRIHAAAADCQVSLKDGRVLSGSKAVEPFVEYWSFLRRHGTKTEPGRPMLIEGNCPNCGAAIEINQSANCQHCGAVLRSGQYDWVLAEITQASEWTPGGEGNVPGAAQLLEMDPGFNRQQLEDRASVMFWRRAMADRQGTVGPLRKMATAEFCQRYEQRLGEQGGRAFFGDCGVGAVEAVGVVCGQEMDRALVKIRWAGNRFVVDRNGQAQKTDRYLVTESLFVLGRKAGAQTQVDRVISSAHCPHCGGPETDTAADRCEFCGAVLNDGTHDWVLMDVLSMVSGEAQRLLEQAGENGQWKGQRQGMSASNRLALMVRASLADGEVGEAERRMLMAAGAKRGLAAEQLERMIDAAAQKSLDLPQPRDQEEARQWLGGMVAMALADGVINREEGEMLRQVARSYGFGEYDLRMLISRQRAELVAAAREELRRRNGRNGG
ncbi:MAG: TIM44-like domain-containing protein, partial [Bacillota bacterium]